MAIETLPTTTDACRRSSSSSSSHRTAATIRNELEFLARRHAHLLALGDEHEDDNIPKKKKKNKDRKKILEARHATREFHGNYPTTNDNENIDNEGDEPSGYYLELFDEFARAVCHTAVIPRKELFEAWAMALYVHFYFPPTPGDDAATSDVEKNSNFYYKRVADMGCGQGLVSWALLFLDQSRTRTAIGIDKKIPKACDVIEKVMSEHHPGVAGISEDLKSISGGEDASKEERKDEDDTTATQVTQPKAPPRKQPNKRWHWVEGDICKNIRGDASTLIVGVHCCGTLTDTVMDLAISSGSALALVPCCHTRRSLPKEYHNNPKKVKELLKENGRKNETNDSSSTAAPLLPTTLTDCVDQYRMQKLTDAGFIVKEETIPSVITPKNRIIVATPPPPRCKPANAPPPPPPTISTNHFDTNKHSSNKQPSHFTIPLADTPDARSVVATQSGRIAADLRQRRPPLNLSLSLYLPHPDALSPEQFNAFCEQIAKEEQSKLFPDQYNNINGDDDDDISSAPSLIATHVEYGRHGPFFNPELGNYSRPYLIQYSINEPTGRLPQVTKAQAKAMHATICQRIQHNALGEGVALRQGIKEKTHQ